MFFDAAINLSAKINVLFAAAAAGDVPLSQLLSASAVSNDNNSALIVKCQTHSKSSKTV